MEGGARWRALAIAAIAVGLALASGGCSILSIYPEGMVTAEEHGILRLDGSGSMLVAAGDERTERLRIQTAAERERYGIVLADGSAIPPGWASHEQGRGQVLVSALEKGSPLAVAGLRPLDVIEAVNGRPIASPAAGVELLRAAPPGARVTVDVRRGDRGRALERLEIEAPRALRDESEVYVPLVYLRKSGRLGSSLGLGPLDALFTYRSVVEDEEGPDRTVGYTRRTWWGALLGFVNYTSTSTRLDGVRGVGGRTTLRIFWFIPVWSRRASAEENG